MKELPKITDLQDVARLTVVVKKNVLSLWSEESHNRNVPLKYPA